MKNALLIIGIGIIQAALTINAYASDVLLDVSLRQNQLQEESYRTARELCLANHLTLPDQFPEPIAGLKTTEGYGADNRMEAFSWQVMVLAGRSLAGEDEARQRLINGLLQWAESGALLQGDTAHDSYYALKRYLLPAVISLSIIDPALTVEQRDSIVNWLQQLIPPLDKHFGGNVDRNNHRYLADSVLMAWGIYTQNEALIQTGIDGFRHAIDGSQADGSLPLETRRGARALWYMRHALSSLVMMAEMDYQRSGKPTLYNYEKNGKSLANIVHYFVSASYAPMLILPQAAENITPGPSEDYLEQDQGHLRQRGHGRHYMAFAEAYLHRPNFAAKRLRQLLAHHDIFPQRPLIDEYFGGNASCFFWQPAQTEADAP